MRSKNFLFFMAALLGGCATPVTLPPSGSAGEIRAEVARLQGPTYKKMMQDEDRAFSVVFPIFAANSEFCGSRVAPSLGMTFWNLPSVREEYRPAASAVYGLHDALAAQFVADRSPASRAGLRSGDLILAINGQEISPGYDAPRAAYQALQSAGYDPVKMTVERGGKVMTKTVQPVEACAYQILIDHSSKRGEVNAYADGNRIVLNKAMMRFVKSDNELALVIAHELAHNSMGHIDKKMQNTIVGALGGLVIDSVLSGSGVNTGSEFTEFGGSLGAEAHSVEFEQEADYVGMYYMVRAGYNPNGVADFWRRMALKKDTMETVAMRTTHPSSPERFVALEHARQEVMKKKATGKPLIPNYRQ